MLKWLFVILLIFLPEIIFAQFSRLNPEEKYPFIQFEKKVWFSNNNGLIQYSPDDDAFKTLSIPSRYGQNKIRRIYGNQEWLWFLLDSGIAALHTRLNDWLFFDSTNGLPSSRVNSISFLDDYVWISTDNGIARFDMLIEQWEIFGKSRGLPQSKIEDLLTFGKQIWILTDNGLGEYDPQFEKWRFFDLNLNAGSKRIFKVADDIWIPTDVGFFRFNIQLHTSQSYNQSYFRKENIIDVFFTDDQIAVFSMSGLFLFDRQSSSWKEFEGNSSLKDIFIVNGFINQSQIWILTSQNVMLWDKTKKNWEFFDYSTGLSSSAFQSVYSDGNLTFLCGNNFLDYRRSSSESWKKFLLPSSSGSFGSNILQTLFDSEEGGFVKFGEKKLSFFGTRINYLSDWKRTIPDTGKRGTIDFADEKRIDFKSQFSIDESRRITAYYNNIDFSETMYGLRYRGKDSDSASGDLVREVNLGDFRKEPGSNPFAEKANIYGANVWLQYGNKTSKFKKSLLTLKAGTGEVRTQKTYETFNGARNQIQTTINDISYVKNRFYSIDGITKNDFVSEVSVFIDDKISSNNNQNTLAGYVVAGISGDYDKLVPTEDYFIPVNSNHIIFNSLIGSTWTIAIKYKVNGVPKEEILQLDSVISKQKLNVYYLSGQNIIPFSLNMKIRDLAKNEIPLSKFRLENKQFSGKINPDFIDFKNGYLIFPDSKPFPDEVYSQSPVSNYSIEVSYNTEVAMLQLQNINLVRGSEVLKVDGTVASGGNDYVIDYTNGTLIFVREGVLNPDTRIEVEYEYYRTEFDRLHYGSLNFSPSDNFFVQADWQSIKPDSNNLLSVHSELRQNVGNFLDLRLIPGLAFQTKERRITSGFYDFFLSTSWIRVRNTFQRFDKDYSNIYKPKGIIGDLSDRMIVNAVSDLLKELRLTYNHTTLTGNGKTITKINYWSKGPDYIENNGGIIFHANNLPGIQINYQNERTNFVDSSEKKQFIIGQLDYQLPKKLVSAILLNGVKIESFLRMGEQYKFASDTTKIKFFQNYYKVSSQFTEQIQGSFFYRINKQDDITHASLNPLQKSERLLIDFSQEQWRLLQINLRFESNLDQYNNFLSETGNYYQRQFAQVNLRFSPGQMSDLFKTLFFEFNFNQFLNSSGKFFSNASSDLWSYGSSGNSTDSYVMKGYYLKNEFRPSTKFFFTTIFEWNSQDVNSGLSTLNRGIRTFTEKMDIRLDLSTHLIAQYKQNYQYFGFERYLNEYEPSLWLERRWSPDLSNILNLLFRKSITDIGLIHSRADAIQAQLDMIYRKNKIFYMKYVEMRQSFITQFNTESATTSDNYQLASSTSVDIYPFAAFIVRGRFDILRFVNIGARPSSFWTTGFNLKLSLQL